MLDMTNLTPQLVSLHPVAPRPPPTPPAVRPSTQAAHPARGIGCGDYSWFSIIATITAEEAELLPVPVLATAVLMMVRQVVTVAVVVVVVVTAGVVVVVVVVAVALRGSSSERQQ